MLRALFIVSALASPLTALDQSDQLRPPDQQSPKVPSPDDKDLCSYLKDVEGKRDADCDQDALAILKSADAAAYSQKLELASQRKTAVLKAHEYLKAWPESRPPGPAAQLAVDLVDENGRSAPPDAGKSEQPLPTQLEPPINERTFPAWLGPEAADLKEIQTRWLQIRNQDLKREVENSITPEQKKRIEAALAANQARITALDRIKDPAELTCFLGESCGARQELSNPAAVNAAAGNGAWTKDDYERANEEARGQDRAAASKFKTSPSEVPLMNNDVAEKSENQAPLPLLPLAAPLGVGLIGYGVYRSRQAYVSESGLNPESKDEPTQAATRANRFIVAGLAAAAIVGTGWLAVTYLPPLLAAAGPAASSMTPAFAGAAGGAIALEEAAAVGAAKAGLLAGGAYAGARALSQIKTGPEGPGYSFAKSKDDENSRLRGRESKRQHDRGGQLRDKDFRRWFHRNWKKPGDPDASNEALKEAYEEWVRQGKP